MPASLLERTEGSGNLVLIMKCSTIEVTHRQSTYESLAKASFHSTCTRESIVLLTG